MRFSRATILFTLVSVADFASPRAHAEESMFPSAPVAKPFMDFDGKGFIVNGQRTYVSSASIHYPRVPKDL